jgi:hypothetical protein
VKIACCYNKILSSSSLTYTLGFSRGGVRDNLTHYVLLKRKLELSLEFDSFPPMCCICVHLLCFSFSG